MKIGVFIFLALFAVVFCGCEQNKVETPMVEKTVGIKREILDVEKNPALTAVGKVNLIGRQWCSLTLVADDIAVTAGHCFLKSNFKFDLKQDLNPIYCPVIFKPNGRDRLENISVKRILKAQMEPDYAIVSLTKKIPESLIKPLQISKLTFEEMSLRESNLGCAAFSGDSELGSQGLLMTISRNIKLVPESSSKDRIDTTCFATYGSSGGLFFNERNNTETNRQEFDLIGVVWGVTDEKYDENGKLVKDENVITSITPVSVFYDELIEIIDQNSKLELKNGKSRIENQKN